MSGPGQRSEKPTPRRLQRARTEGRFATSREATSAAQFAAFVALAVTLGPAAFVYFCRLVRYLFAFAFRPVAASGETGLLVPVLFRNCVLPLLWCATLMALAGLATQLAVTQFGFAPGRVAPDLSRWSPWRRLRDLPSQNIAAGVQALLLGPVLGYAAYEVVHSNLAAYLALPLASPRGGMALVALTWKSFLLKAAFAVVGMGALDLVRQKRKYTRELRMSKQEIRDEAKESEGNPQIKGKIRRLQRDLARRSMMKEVPLATAVIVNPTHYAVALRYESGTMAAPRVVAKGRNYLALRIRQIAIEHQVPIIENPPLAQALYKAVDVGQEIPAHLFRAVAEILAYIFRLMNPRARQGNA